MDRVVYSILVVIDYGDEQPLCLQDILKLFGLIVV